MNTRAPVCTFLLCNLLKCVVEATRCLATAADWDQPPPACFENFSLYVRKHQVLFDRTLQQLCASMLRCGRAPSKMIKTSSLIGTRGAKMTHVTVLCSITWWTKPMSGDMTSVMLTFLLRGATTRRTRSPNGARPLFLLVKMLNPDSSMYTWRWWTPVKEGIDDVAQTGKCEYWPRLTNHVAY